MPSLIDIRRRLRSVLHAGPVAGIDKQNVLLAVAVIVEYGNAAAHGLGQQLQLQIVRAVDVAKIDLRLRRALQPLLY